MAYPGMVHQDGNPPAFSHRTQARLRQADALCVRRGARLTDIRRLVLGFILEAEAPLGAYDLLDRLRMARAGAAPPTVYRARDFLLEHGLVHRVERLAAFVGCVAEDHDSEDQGGHPAQFLICRGCGHVAEIDDPEVSAALARAAAGQGFSLARATVEAEGLCTECARLSESAAG